MFSQTKGKDLQRNIFLVNWWRGSCLELKPVGNLKKATTQHHTVPNVRMIESTHKFSPKLFLGRKQDKLYYVEIKCQLDATDDIYCRFYCMFNMFRAILCPSSGAREYYTDGRCLQLHTIPTTWKPKHQIPQAATICIILSSSWWWA